MSKLQRLLRKSSKIVPGMGPLFEERCFYPRGWGKAERGFFNRESKAYLFRSIVSFFSTHEVAGDYFEFGCFGGFTMRMAWDHFRVLHSDKRYFAFDSFQGFPAVEGDDVGHWKQGDLAMSEDKFRKVCRRHGMPDHKLTTIPGFFEESLASSETAEKLSGTKAAVVYVDVDTYTPATEVLNFVAPYLQRGSVLVFDDWNCFYCDDSLGERRAWTEFTRQHSDLGFAPFVATHLAQSFICLGTREA